MSGAEFKFSRKKDVEDPLYLDVVATRPRGERAFEFAPDVPGDPDRPLRLDPATRDAGRSRGGIPLVITGAVILLVAAAAAVGAVLLPSRLQVRPAPSAAPAQAADASLASQAASATAAVTPPAVQEEGAPVVQTQTAPTPVEPPTSPKIASQTAHEHARPHAVPKAREEAGKRGAPHAVTAKRQRSGDAETARPNRRASEELNLDALAKSLQ